MSQLNSIWLIFYPMDQEQIVLPKISCGLKVLNFWQKDQFHGQTALKKGEIKMLERKFAECFMIYGSVPAVNKLISRFSNYYKLKRAVAWLSEFKHYL